tara:strand:- start:339 stop:518 length:180 start_codon:yes stop_codon:yes gene_type:complete
MNLSKKGETFILNKKARGLVNYIASLSYEMLVEEGEEIIDRAYEIQSQFSKIENQEKGK